MNVEDDGPPLLIDTSDINKEEPDIIPTPVTVVTGYLGSGKSTLLKHITHSNQDKRIAVVLNEFGQTSDIEKSLNIRNSNPDGSEVEQWVELDNGCMCCTAKDAGVSAIEKLMKRSGRFDYIIIETSGLADPAPIARMFWLDDALQAKVKLDGVVTVVDANTILRSLDDGKLASLQISCADVLLINKCDLVSEDQMHQVRSTLKHINGAAQIIECSYGNVDTNALLDLKAYSTSFPSIEPVRNTEHGHSHASHDLSTEVIGLPSLSFAQFRALESNLQHILWENDVCGHKVEIHRTKGKLQVIDEQYPPQTKIVQGVREVYEIIDVDYEPEGVCKIVFIGRGLDEARSAMHRILGGV